MWFKKQEKEFVKDILPEGKTGIKVKIDLKKLNEKAEQCLKDKQNKECRIKLREIGVEWVE